jgi:regulatory GntR family protein
MTRPENSLYRLGDCRGPIDGGGRNKRTPASDVVLEMDPYLEITPNCGEFVAATGKCGLTGGKAHCIFWALNGEDITQRAETAEEPQEPDQSYLQKLPRLSDSPSEAPLPVIKPLAKRPNLAVLARRRLTMGIITGELPVGTRLSITNIAQTFMVSKTVPRIALGMMAKQGIVERLPGKQTEKVFMIRQDPRDIPTTDLNPALRVS